MCSMPILNFVGVKVQEFRSSGKSKPNAKCYRCISKLSPYLLQTYPCQYFVMLINFLSYIFMEDKQFYEFLMQHIIEFNQLIDKKHFISRMLSSRRQLHIFESQSSLANIVFAPVLYGGCLCSIKKHPKMPPLSLSLSLPGAKLS